MDSVVVLPVDMLIARIKEEDDLDAQGKLGDMGREC